MTIYTTSKSGGYATGGGNSFSTPVAAAVAALVLAASPTLDPEGIEFAVLSTAVDLGASGVDPNFGYGRVDAAAAVALAPNLVQPSDSEAPNVTITSPATGSTVTGQIPVSVTATDNISVAKVELYASGALVATDTAAPFRFQLGQRQPFVRHAGSQGL